MDWLGELFSSAGFMPHGHCYFWQRELLWLQVITNVLIGLAYFAITATLTTLVVRVRDIPFRWMYGAFGVFIVTCGVTHFMDVVVIWEPEYWLDGALRAVTALASVATALFLPPLVPKAIAIARAAQAAHDRGIRLESAVKDLEAMYQRSREMEALKTQFFANVSHELRTPLTLILGPVDALLGADRLAPADRARLETVARNARTLLGHVEDLLDVAKLDAGRLRLTYADVDVGALVRRVAAAFATHAADHAVALEVDAPGATAEVDPDHVQRIATNLLGNAIKFTPDGGRIVCRLRADHDRLTLEVADSGPGIPADQRAAIFERYRQVEGTSARAHGGTGLGLAIVRELARLHGGEVTVGDGPLGGARFVVELPVRAPAGEPVARGEDAVAETRAPAPVSAGGELALAPPAADADEVVLVVDDNPDMRRFVAETLAADVAVITAVDGADALRVAEARPPAVIVSDVMMPNLTGDQLLEELRRRPALAEIPVILLTAKAEERFRADALRRGAQDYLAKPFAPDELRARVGNLRAMKRARELLRARLASTEQDVSVLARALAARNHELEATAAARDRFLRAMSHELRTPLTTLTLQVELLGRMRGDLPARALVITEKMDGAVVRLADLVDSIFELIRADAGRLAPSLDDADLVALAREVVAEHALRAERKGLALALAAPASARLHTDARLVRLVVSNLLDNAIKYTREGRVDLAIEPAGDGWSLTVEDTGPGIPVEDQARIFRPFEQGGGDRTEHAHAPGAGLGLAVVDELVRALGGAIVLDSAPGRGTRFRVTWPARASAP